MKTEMMKTEKLLKEVNWFLKNKKLEVANNEDTFNMFRICGVNHYENTHQPFYCPCKSFKYICL